MREFNRFYTARLGLLRRRYLEGEFALTEARILFEIGAQPGMRASDLCSALELDAGYVSRLLASLTKRRLVRQQSSARDRREKLLALTASGEKAVARLNASSNAQIETLLAKLSVKDREAVVASLLKVRSLLGPPQEPVIRIERLMKITPEAVAILHEYYEAIEVVVRDKAGDLQKLVDAPASGIWIAYLDDAVVGCVVLRELPSIAKAGECKRLYVRPAARGHRIASLLLDAMEEFASGCGLRWIYLDSHDGLKAAISLYEKREYKRCKRYNDNPQATIFMRRRITAQAS
ncbi:bifunctional helix-turn-helix transcriptional regulator/GNAT family N-acetyltransferase [Silvibacterium sp.]|uniref:bifunctional helix-turn-helix transcriptional regulator/GNAT family N-acetyltransferase n=1 Tax=Silvibacterium sp. TaxID=1964179 RepID=UPI0039E4180D